MTSQTPSSTSADEYSVLIYSWGRKYWEMMIGGSMSSATALACANIYLRVSSLAMAVAECDLTGYWWTDIPIPDWWDLNTDRPKLGYERQTAIATISLALS